jgi:hypothetical protein
VGGVIGLFTILVIKEQSKIANRTLVATFRPKVILRTMGMGNPTASDWNVELTFVNTGGTSAAVTSGTVNIEWLPDIGSRGAIPISMETIKPFRLVAGESITLPFAVADSTAEGNDPIPGRQ